MSRIAYVNGRYVPQRDATVHVEDRGYQFSDGVYEVCEVRGGRLVDERRHMDAARALARRTAHRHADAAQRARRRAARDRRAATACATASSICRSRAASRGATMLSAARHARRASWSPRSATISTKLERGAGRGRASRSSRCRTTAGRGSTSSRSRCCRTCSPSRRRASRAPEAWFVDRDGHVTEGSSTNAWIVTADGKVVTRAGRSRHPARASPATVLLDVIAAQGLELEERAVHGGGGAMRRARPSSPRRPRS